MSTINEYKIVNATELDNALASLANSLRTIRGEASSKEYTFPQDFVDAVSDLYYAATNNSAADVELTLDNSTGECSTQVAAGRYPSTVTKEISLPLYSGDTSYEIEPTLEEQTFSFETAEKYNLENLSVTVASASSVVEEAINELALPDEDVLITKDETGDYWTIMIPVETVGKVLINIPEEEEEAP